MSTALVVAAHPDDEVLGCGGTIARLASDGWSVHIRIVSEGSTSRDETRDVSKHELFLTQLRLAAEEAARITGASSLAIGDLPDNRMDSVDLLDVVKIVEKDVLRLRPNLVLTHHVGDVNIDHRIVHDAVVTACRSQPHQSVGEILFFEVNSSTEWRPASSAMPFLPNVFFDITDFLDRKLAALTAYAGELRPFPHPRSTEAVKHLAQWRGSTVGRHAAEAFMLGRRIV